MSKQDVYSLLLPFIPSDYHFLEARHRHRLFLPCKGTADERLTKYRRATLLKFDENFPKSQIPVFHKISSAVPCLRFLLPPSGIARKNQPCGEPEGSEQREIKNEAMTAIEQITAIAEKLGWQVRTDTDKPNLVVFDFQQYTPYGQDFGFSVEMKGNDTDSLIDGIEEYYEGFDPDYEAHLWIGTDGHGKNGAPYHIKDIVSDMEEAEKMIETLYETLKKAIA